MLSIVEENKDKLIDLCIAHNVKELFIFGSALTDQFNEESDIDFAVILKENLSPIEYGETFLNLLNELKEIFNRNIDLVSYRVIKNPIFKEELDRTKNSLYAAA
jgi:predicted nucleotidyltransferase